MKNNILHILQQGENEKVELKTSFSKVVIETLVAFANAKGGVVYVGVKDNGEVVGVDLGEESLQIWINEIKVKTTPSIIPDIDVVSLEGKTIARIKIQEYPVKPIACQGKFYKRVAASNHLMNASDISDLYMKSMQYSWDAYPYQDATFEDLNTEKIMQFIQKVNASGRFRLPMNPKEALIKLRLIKDDVPTNAAMILFSKQDLLYNVHIGRFKTPSTIIADNMVSGNLYDVVEKSMEYIVSHIKFAFEITGKTTQRTEIPEYPLEALRELLLNAIIHRDYQSSTDIQIKIFDQSISFFNPSGLYGDITIEDLKTDVYTASTRNKLIAEAFYLTKDIEKYGSGFIRIRKQIASYPTMAFNYRNEGYGFFAEFSYTQQKTTNDVTDSVTNNVTENRRLMILSLIKEDNKISITRISAKLNVTRRTIIRDIEVLKQKNLLVRVGSAKGGYWEIKYSSYTQQKTTNDVTDSVINNVTDNVTDNVTENVAENRRLMILSLIKEDNKISITRISAKLNVTRRTIIRDIEVLKQKNLLVRVGSAKAGHWEIKHFKEN